jgi:hypothetical protein
VFAPNESIGNAPKNLPDVLNVGIVGNFNRSVKRYPGFHQGHRRWWHQELCQMSRFTLVGGGDQEKTAAPDGWPNLGILADRTQFVGRVDNAMPYIETLDVGVNTSAIRGASRTPSSNTWPRAGRWWQRTLAAIRELIEHGINGFLFPVGDYPAGRRYASFACCAIRSASPEDGRRKPEKSQRGIQPRKK